MRGAALLLLFVAACGPKLTPEEMAYARLERFLGQHRTSRNWTSDDRAAAHRLVRAYLDLPRHEHPEWQGRAYPMLWRIVRRDPRADRGELLMAIRGMEQHASFPLPRFIESSRLLAERNIDLDYAERLARRGVIESHRYFQRHPEENDSPKFIAGVVARAHESLAIVLEKRGRYGEAEQERFAAAAMFRSAP